MQLSCSKRGLASRCLEKRLPSSSRLRMESGVNLGALATTFGLIFVAELPDKTLYTILLLATRHRGLPVFLGACGAFLVQVMLAVAVGSLFGQLPPGLLHWGTAALFLGFGLLMLLREEPAEELKTGAVSSRRLALLSFGLVFAAEFGDATQIGTAALSASLHARWEVFFGATLALWLTAALAVTVGRYLRDRLDKKLIRRGAGLLFCAFALFTAIHGAG